MNRITLKESPETFIDRRNMPYIPGQEIIITQKSKPMKTKMRKESLDTYENIRASLPRRKRQVYDVMVKLGPMSNMQIAIELRLPINYITGRTNALVNEDNLVYAHDKILDLISNQPVTRWNIIPVGKQLEIY